MVIDTDLLRPQLAGVTGGLSGPAVRPVAVRALWQVTAAMREGRLPVGAAHRGRGSAHRPRRPRAGRRRRVAPCRSAPRPSTTPSRPRRVVDELEAEVARHGFDPLRRRRRHRPREDGPPVSAPRPPSACGCAPRWTPTARSASASTRTAALLETWGLPVRRRRARALRDDLRRGVRRAGGRRSSRSRPSSRCSARGVSRCSSGCSPACATAGTLSILDAKRGDIGSTMAAYAQASSPTRGRGRADALTVSPYLGYGSLRPALDLAAADRARGVRAGPHLQPRGARGAARRGRDGRSVAASVVAGAAARQRRGRRTRASSGTSGSSSAPRWATPSRASGLDLAGSAGPLLAPGLGAQGGTARATCASVFGDARPTCLPNVSRSVLVGRARRGGAAPRPRAPRRPRPSARRAERSRRRPAQVRRTARGASRARA